MEGCNGYCEDKYEIFKGGLIDFIMLLELGIMGCGKGVYCYFA